MSSTKKKITINAASAIIQVTFTAVLYFFLYKYLLNHLGAKQLGVWSLILSFSSIANLANFGMTSGLVKFVADYLAEKNEQKIGKLIFTAFLSLASFFSFVSLLVFIAAHYFLHFIIDKQFLSLALSILPYSLGGLCINAASGVFTSVLEGHQKNYLRNFIYIFSGIVMFVSMVILTPIYHLQGMAYAQLIQAVFILVFALILIFKINHYNRIRYWKWSNQSFKELFNYGYKFQVVSICQLLYEPTTKMLLSRFGGLALLGHYEMATRLVTQFRSLIVNANQVVIPVVAEKVKTQTKEHIQEFYGSMNRIIISVALPLSTLLILMTPLISILWIGHYEYEFIIPVYILAIGYLVNITSGPSFFSCMGEGHLNIPIISHISMAILNLILGYLLGILIGGYGIVLGWGLSLSIGSITTILLYQKKIGVKYFKLLSKFEFGISFISIFMILSSFLFFLIDIPFLNNFYKTIILVILFILLNLSVFYRNGKINEIAFYLKNRK